MRIKSLHVQRYGPLAAFGPHDLAPFSLIYGPNEQGKTLLIDAVLRMLFKNELGRRVKFFGNIRRVEEQPEGYIVLDIKGDEIKLERDTTLSELIDIGPSEFRNIFVVRDSDLSIYSPGDHYTRVSEKLAGLKSSRILNIKKALQKKGRLTNPGSTAGLANNEDTDHSGQKVKDAADCLDEIDRAYDALKRQDFDTLERALLDREAKLETLKEELDLLGKAKTHKRFQTARGRLETLETIECELEAGRHLRAEDLDSWKQAEHDMKRLRGESDEAKKEQARIREKSSSLEDKKTDSRNHVDRLDGRIKAFDDHLAPILVEHDVLSRMAAAETPRRKMWLSGAAVSSVLLVFSLVAAIVDSTVYYGPMALVFFLSAVFFGWRLIAGRQAVSKLAEVTEEIRLLAARHGIEAGTVETVHKHRDTLDEELQGARAQSEQASAGCLALDKEMETWGARAEKIRGKIRLLEGTINDIRRRSDVDTAEEMDRALKKRIDFISEKRSLVALLSELTGARDDGNKDERAGVDTAKWREIITNYFNRVPDGAETLEHDEAREQTLKGEVAVLEEAAGTLRDDLDSGRDFLRDLESRINKAVPQDDGETVCRTVEDLVRARLALNSFVERIEREKQEALVALEVFEEIESEEKTRVLELFGADANVSSYFTRITQGRYTEVKFDLETTKITVIRSDGEPVEAENLSGGALDQLHFAIRLSIGERLFPGGKGLLILDDPFIKSDQGRLIAQITLLREVVAEGWQVIYFSAKEEVKTLLDPDIAAGRAMCFKLDGIRGGTSNTDGSGGN